MNNDLISREALKDLTCGIIDEEGNIHQVVLLADIDNAPTVDLWQMRQEATENALKKAEVLYGRPQGKWLEYNATGKKQYMCSECSMKEKNPKIARYCYWCGAKMKGGAE